MALLCSKAVNEGEELKSQTARGCRPLSLPPVVTWLAKIGRHRVNTAMYLHADVFRSVFCGEVTRKNLPLVTIAPRHNGNFISCHFLPKQYIVRRNSAALLSKKSYSYPLSQDL